MPSFSERVALFRIQQYLAKYRPYVVMVAGTYGRTLATQALYHAIARHRHARIGFGIEKKIGLLRTLVGSKMREIAEIEPDTIMGEVPLVRPEYAPNIAGNILPRLLILSHIGAEHIDLFGSKDMVAHEYLAVANTLQADAAVVLNADEEHLLELREHINHPVITYGMHPDADIRLTRAKRMQGIFAEFIVHNVRYEAHFPHLVSKQHVAGMLAGIAGAHAMGIDIQDAIAGLRNLTPPHGSFSTLPGIKSSRVIDDTADVCPEKLGSSLKSFSLFDPDSRKFIVLGDMDNLSQYAIKSHEELGKQAATVAPILIFVGDMMRHAQAAALKTGTKIDTHHFVTSADAAAWLPDHIRQNDVVYITGGKNMEMAKIVKALSFRA
ncbi:MAG: hypothetical protein A3C02_02255 [Candidatus Andersenbacteria bacterium RIFCSPHIGHO2_02_FULL_45_11]|nr:MAG: hypothetical protein A2805_02710 [Candidatus Andersenbacteria bacterium RIFCSPHIGHO2_01_FULL_46_36]OGY32550.1 MAG: hypothetical protein A3C02_02255 [Candidatus Andersenbacteria bacterium RIFCSPHIGHO2_02_FULL_45_11]